MRNLQINGAPSPYPGSTNQSTTSIQANLQRERGITPTTNGLRNSRASGNGSTHQQPLSPMSGPPEMRPGESRHAFNMRTAPIISANPMREVYNADKPTAGQPYAFPDPDMNGSSGSNEDPRRVSTTGMSRRNSEHASINSSLYTTDTRQSGSQRPMNGGMSPVTPTDTTMIKLTDVQQTTFQPRIITVYSIGKSVHLLGNRTLPMLLRHIAGHRP